MRAVFLSLFFISFSCKIETSRDSIDCRVSAFTALPRNDGFMESKSIAHNTAWMTIASIGQKIISFAYFTVLARNIGVENTGKYFFALSFTTIFVVFVDLGLTSVLVREGAKAKEKIQNYFSTILSVKIFLGILTYIAAIIAINLMGYAIETRHLVYLSAVTMLFDSLHLSVYGTLRAYGNLRYEAIGTICSQFLTMILGTCFLYAGLPLIYLIAAFTIPSFCNVCYSSTILYRNYKVKFLPRYDAVILKFMAKIAIPFALTAIFTRLYAFADSILLSKLAGNEAVGWYSIPYKITFAFQFLPLALGASLFPRFSEYFVSDKQKLARAFEQGMKYLMLIVFPIAIGIGVLAHDIVLTLYKEQFINSVLPLQILMVSLVFLFLSGPVSTLLNACDRQVTQTGIIGFVAITNITLNIFLIPRFGVVGAASAALVGNFLIFAIGYCFAPKITQISHKYLFKTILQVALSAGVMGLVVYQINQLSNFMIAIFVGALVYCAMIFITQAVKVNDVIVLKSMLKK